MYHKLIFVFLAVALLVLSCSNDEHVVPVVPKYEMGFRSDGIAPATRSVSDFPDGATFGVLAYNCPNGTFDPITTLPDLLYNAQVEKYTSEGVTGYRYFPTAHWPSGASSKVQFGAYYPHSSSVASGAISITPFTSVGLPKITLVMGIEKGSLDFATSVVGPISRVTGSDPVGTPTRTNDYVNFHFKRRMAYLSFRCKTVNTPALTKLYIYKMTLRNIYRRGTFDLADNTWKDQGVDATTGATLNLQSTGAAVSDVEFRDLVDPTSPTGTMFSVIPQTYNNVELTVLYVVEYLKFDGGSEHRIVGTKTVPLSVDWAEGKQHIYDLEFAFDEIYGDNALINFNVQPWKTVDVDTSM